MNEEQKNKAKKELKRMGIKFLGSIICLIVLLIGCIFVYKMFVGITQDTVNRVIEDNLQVTVTTTENE